MEEKCGNYFIGKKISADALKNFEFMTRYNESVHTFMLLVMIWTFNKNFWILDSALHIINLYCILIQRYNRTRIYSVLEKRYNK